MPFPRSIMTEKVNFEYNKENLKNTFRPPIGINRINFKEKFLLNIFLYKINFKFNYFYERHIVSK